MTPYQRGNRHGLLNAAVEEIEADILHDIALRVPPDVLLNEVHRAIIRRGAQTIAAIERRAFEALPEDPECS